MTIDRRTLLAGLTAALAGLPRTATAQPMTQEEVIALLGPGLSGREQIGMMIYPGFTALDFAGPYHFLAGLPGATTHIITTQNDLTPVSSDLGMAIQPTITMANAPRDLTLIFVPGGTAGTLLAARDERVLNFVADRGQRAQHVTSVCTGSLVLGAAGLLRGKRATSHWAALDALAALGATPVRERIVRDGNVITGAGVSAGMDFGASLVGELRGREMAEVATLVAEYAPEPPYQSGTMATARPEIAAAASTMLSGFSADAAALRLPG